MKVDEKLLDKYSDENLSDCKPLSEKDRKAVSETFGFAGFCLDAAWKEFTAAIKADFPWLFGGDAV